MTDTIKIVHETPPLPAPRSGRPPRYDFDALRDVGDAIDAPRNMGTRKNGDDCRLRSMQDCLTQWRRRRGCSDVQITVALLDNNTVRARRDR